MNMRIFKMITVILFAMVTHLASAQEVPAEISTTLEQDDAPKLSTLITKDNINACYGNYSTLSEAIRRQANACFDLLVQRGADLNKSCNGYLPPLMHACKYGNLEMVKTLITKGAKKDYVYDGSLNLTNGPQKGDTPLIYAQRYNHDDIAAYLETLSNK